MIEENHTSLEAIPKLIAWIYLHINTLMAYYIVELFSASVEFIVK